MSDFKNLSQYLKQKRTESTYTQNEVASALNVHVQFVSNWERGLCAPPGHCFQKLIELLKLSREVLVEVMLKDSKFVIESKVYKKKPSKKAK